GKEAERFIDHAHYWGQSARPQARFSFRLPAADDEQGEGGAVQHAHDPVLFQEQSVLGMLSRATSVVFAFALRRIILTRCSICTLELDRWHWKRSLVALARQSVWTLVRTA